jgi:hypothetical protein
MTAPKRHLIPKPSSRWSGVPRAWAPRGPVGWVRWRQVLRSLTFCAAAKDAMCGSIHGKR